MVELTKEEEAALAGGRGEVMQMAYRILVAAGEAADAERLAPVQWAHLSGVNYNTIGDAGREFLEKISGQGAKASIRTTLNPMGFDVDSVGMYGLGEEFVSGQLSIADSYRAMGVEMSFSCIPYEIFRMPPRGAHVAFAESNAAIHANSFDGVTTNKESSFSALASALTGKSPRPGGGGRGGRPEAVPETTVRMRVGEPDELAYGMLGFFAGRVGGTAVNISGLSEPAMDRRQCKAICGGMGTSGRCSKFFLLGEGEDGPGCEKVDFGDEEMRQVRDELDTAEDGDLITLGSPQLGLWEISDLLARLGGRTFTKRCMVFCPRAVKEQAQEAGYVQKLERAGCEVLADCCTCLSPLVDPRRIDSVTTNSIKAAFYLNATGVGTELKPLSGILEDDTS